MENVILIILIIMIIALCMIGCFTIRNFKVWKFRVYIIDLIHSRVCDMINDGASGRDASGLWDMFDNISYNKMLYSFKPLKMEYWFTDDELKLLGYEKDLQSHR